MKTLLLLCAFVLPATGTAVAEHFYVNAETGNDSADGRSPDRSWRTLVRVNSTEFHPGDSLSFHSGQSWSGVLTLHGLGTDKQRITVGAYGIGPRPIIAGDGTAQEVVRLSNVEYWDVGGLEITCARETFGSLQRGVEVSLEGFGVSHGIALHDLYIHSIMGSLERKDTGGIVIRTLKGIRPSRFDGLHIERNIIAHVDRSGIAFASDFVDRRGWFPSTEVHIAENYLEDVGGDGIVPWASERAVVEWNVVRRAAVRSNDYNAGIWPWSSDDTILRWNDVSGTATTRDGQAYDADYNSNNTLFEYNYSHGNQGGMMLICSPGDFDPEASVGNTGALILHNVSYQDGGRVFNISGGSEIVIRDNLVANPTAKETQLVILSDWKGWANDVRITENRFLIAGRVRSGHEISRSDDGIYKIGSGWGGATNVTLDRNAYLPDSDVSPPDEHRKTDVLKRLRSIDWQGPSFNPDNGQDLGSFIKLHREWLRALFRQAGVVK